jgi:hypothetical protein
VARQFTHTGMLLLPVAGARRIEQTTSTCRRQWAAPPARPDAGTVKIFRTQKGGPVSRTGTLLQLTEPCKSLANIVLYAHFQPRTITVHLTLADI